jgi:hypothetical protein
VIAHGLSTAKKLETRQRRFEKFMDMLIRQEKPDFGFKKAQKPLPSDQGNSKANRRRGSA